MNLLCDGNQNVAWRVVLFSGGSGLLLSNPERRDVDTSSTVANTPELCCLLYVFKI